MKTIPLKILLTGILLLSNSALAAQKLALIIGNNNYSHDIGALSNPINDAIAIDKKLKSMGFDTILIKNANKRQMLDAFDTFQEKLEHGSTAIFYYAGHGIEAGNRSYLIPVEATIPKNPNNYSDEFFDMRDKAMNSMLSSAAENKILIIDACRNSLDPIKRAVGGNTRGFSRTSMAVDSQSSNAGKMSVLFSTLSGSEALDASPFAKALLANLDKPNATWPELVSDISTTVRQNTKGTQQVWSEGGTELAYFKLSPIAQVVKPDPSPQVIERIVEKPVERIVERERVVVQENPQAAEITYWNRIKNSNKSSDFQAYVNRYPNGLFVELAQAKLLPKPVEVAQVQVRDRPAVQAQASQNNINRDYATAAKNTGKQYIKVGKQGEVLADDATQWDCVYDSKTKLLWEEKTDNGGLRDKEWMYAWHNPDVKTNGYDNLSFTEKLTTSKLAVAGNYLGHKNACGRLPQCNTFAYQQAVNQDGGICGYNNWQLPTLQQLETIRTNLGYAINHSSDHFKNGVLLNIQYFSKLAIEYSGTLYWSSSLVAGDSSKAKSYDFHNSGGSRIEDNDKVYSLRVRLVLPTQ